ncbi:MAG TPA: hypothetical protein VH914_14610 [Acidimicrobiia bacterium]|nr:hypothetical protein [Acidimicrobiia bacterium]
MIEEPGEAELVAAHCWESEDRVPGRPEMTALRRRLRLRQARWRAANGHPIGSQPMGGARPGQESRPVGSRIDLEYARETGATFLTDAARAAATARASTVEAHQRLDSARMWADLLSSVALSFNLFGDLATDPQRADRALHRWWPDVPGTVSDVRFEHSPGRLDGAYLGNLSTLEAAFVLDHGDGTRGIVGVGVRYHERAKSEVPKPRNLERYRRVAGRSGAFRRGYEDAVVGDLTVLWLAHLLVLSMMQNPKDDTNWARYVVAYPAGNQDFARLCARYREQLVDDSTFASITIEELLAARALRPPTIAALRARYLSDS